jgi:predicted metal-dependent phosphoesterase TrpH
LTDHDTLEGYSRIDPSELSGIQIVTGVEISVDLPKGAPVPGGCHVLGYGIRLDDPELNRTLATLRDHRKNRNPRIIERLNQLGCPLDMETVLQEAGDAQIGRPHIAQSMVRKGYVQTIDEAFDRFLGTGKSAYIPKFRLDAASAIRLIHEAGGVSVLAHPGLIPVKSRVQTIEIIRMFRDLGLRGVEVYYPEHTTEDTRLFLTAATDMGLLVTGGTDFHGRLKPRIRLGTGEGDFFVPYRIYLKLCEAIDLHGTSYRPSGI